MRPRLITAENGGSQFQQRGGLRASMRPRLITAENAAVDAHSPHQSPRFNEAAAHHRGELEQRRVQVFRQGVVLQ